MTDSTTDSPREYHLTPARILIAVIAVITVLVVATWMLHPIRNSKPEPVAVRFLRNCNEIKTEAGEIANVGKPERPPMSQQIARRLQAGEYPFEKEDGENSRFSMLPAGTTVERLRVTGSKREFEAEVSLKKHALDGNETSVYYIVTAAKFQDVGNNWVDVPIGWTDNYFLLFK